MLHCFPQGVETRKNVLMFDWPHRSLNMEQEAREREKEKELAKLTGIANNNESSRFLFLGDNYQAFMNLNFPSFFAHIY